MYAGINLRRGSGRIIGVHQRIDRVARRDLRRLLPKSSFPKVRDILHFEGINGPDGIKRKSPAKDELWHYLDPYDKTDKGIVDIIRAHSVNLNHALKENNSERAAFEAAWLAHAIVDGLTPAHHYPLEAKLEELRGEGLETRTSLKGKLMIQGDTRRDSLKKNWEFWGAKGVMTTHFLFEVGVATTMAPLRLKQYKPETDELRVVEEHGIIPTFHEALEQIAKLKMYEAFQTSGWSQKLARQTREVLVPLMVKIVVLAWYSAAFDNSPKVSKKR